MESATVNPTPPLKFILESLLFSAQKPLTTKELKDYLALAAQDETAPEAAPFKKVREDDIASALAELEQDHQTSARSYRLACIGGSWQFVSQPEFAPWLRALLGRKARPPRLSQPGVETLTIIAYRQPVTRAEIEQIRGVSVDGVMQTLLERGLIEAAGRAEVVGRPVTYVTTPLFLEYFGIRALEDLPAADELRRLPVQKPDSLLTLDPAATPDAAPAPQPELPITESPADPAPTTETPTPPTPETDGTTSTPEPSQNP
jgi:segregation and condensation protein B